MVFTAIFRNNIYNDDGTTISVGYVANLIWNINPSSQYVLVKSGE